MMLHLVVTIKTADTLLHAGLAVLCSGESTLNGPIDKVINLVIKHCGEGRL